VGDRAVASLGDDDFGAALGAAVSFTYLICHGMHPFIEFTLHYMPRTPLLSKLALPTYLKNMGIPMYSFILGR
jgi:hypothetical protein